MYTSRKQIEYDIIEQVKSGCLSIHKDYNLTDFAAILTGILDDIRINLIYEIYCNMPKNTADES